jgi:hypothetical protein
MPRQMKYDEIPFEKPEYQGKIFMYSTPGWETLFSIVDIIRILKKPSIISTRNGKGQNEIRMYGQQYNHRVLHDDLNNKKDYLSVFKSIKCAFVFNNTSDYIVTNVIQVCNLLKIPVICYSSIDSVYHFTYLNERLQFNTPEEVINKMYSFFDLKEAKKIADLFPDFEIIIPEEHDKTPTTLDRCHDKLKEVTLIEKRKKDLNNIKLFDPHLAKIKKMERDRIKVDYPDDIEKINKTLQKMSINVFSKKINK